MLRPLLHLHTLYRSTLPKIAVMASESPICDTREFRSHDSAYSMHPRFQRSSMSDDPPEKAKDWKPILPPSSRDVPAFETMNKQYKNLIDGNA